MDVLHAKRGAHDRVELGEGLFQELLQQVPLAVEVEGEGAVGDIRAAGGGVDGGGPAALRVEHLLGCLLHSAAGPAACSVRPPSSPRALAANARSPVGAA